LLLLAGKQKPKVRRPTGYAISASLSKNLLS
jgi:hypothetical protein